jgi:flavin reductase (DIM6/NTAB) family NADH-FMN oxidoreductase RutF
MTHTPPDSRDFRRTLGTFATGVTVIATGTPDEPVAMTVNSFTSLSLDPMLVLFCPHKEASFVPYLRQHGGYSVNVLTQQQRDLSVYFANAWPTDTKPPYFEFKAWQGGPRLEYSIASIGCTLHNLVDGGDHWIAIGEVVALHKSLRTDLKPLVYYRGHYRELAPTPEYNIPVVWDFSW